MTRNLPGVPDLMNVGREKGVSFILGLLNVSGIRKFIGKDSAGELLALCTNIVGLKITDEETAKFIAGIFGSGEREDYSFTAGNKSSSTTRSRQKMDSAMAGEFQEIEAPDEHNGNTIGAFIRPYTGKATFVEWKGEGEEGWYKLVPFVTPEMQEKEGRQPRSRKTRLRQWDEKDLKRLGIGISIEKFREMEKRLERQVRLEDSIAQKRGKKIATQRESETEIYREAEFEDLRF